MTAILLPPGTYRGLDTGHALDDEQLAALARHDCVFVMRYTRTDGVVLDAPKPGGDWNGCDSLSIEERERYPRHSLLLGPLQFGEWGPGVTGRRGHQLGLALRSCARQLGIDPAVHLWPDYEGAAVYAAGPGAGREALEALAAAACPDAGMACGLYYSLPQPLTGAQLRALRGITSYWGAAQKSLALPTTRGIAIRQSLMRAGWRTSAHRRWCDELRCDCPVPARTFGPVPECPVRPGLHCWIPIGAPGHDPDLLQPDLLGEMPLLAA